MPRIGVVGAGIIGLALARRVLELAPGATVTVLDKEAAVATHQSGRNSGVVHAGIYYAPGSLKARLCRRGRALLRAYCEERDIPFRACGKLVVATNQEEVARLGELEARARANGVPGLRRLSAAELRELEPHVRGAAALHSPTTAITDFGEVARALAGDVQRAGGSIVLNAEVTGIEIVGGAARVATTLDRFEFDRLVICAGVHADRVARMAGDVAEPAIIPFRGEYFRLAAGREQLVRGLVYPVPDPRYPFLGVHFTTRVDGGVDVGPNAVLALGREAYRRREIDLRDLLETVTAPGFRALARRHWRMGARELETSLSKRAFVAAARRYVPELSADDLAAGRSGIRAQAVDRDGSLVDDFRISRLGPVTAVRNAPSPGGTSSLAIAEHIAAQIVEEATVAQPGRG